MSQRGGKALKPFNLDMKKIRAIPGLSKLGRTVSRKRLIENNNNEEREDEHDLTQNTSNAHEERRRPSEELAQLLSASTSEDEGRPFVCLVQSHVSQCFPKTPADVDQKLGQHLSDMQETVHLELVKLGPALQSQLQSQELIECFHRHTFHHLDDLLQKVSSSRSVFVLMDWVLRTYLSQGLLGDPELQDMDPVNKVDLLLFTDWVSRAEDKLLQTVQAEISRFLANILQNEKSHEAHDELYVDTIQCIDAMPTEALKISPTLSDRVQKVCFQELLMFLTRYTTEQADFLCKKAKTDKQEIKPFFQTLNNCKELKKHVQTKAGDKEIMSAAVATLEIMEAFTLKLLMEIVADSAENHLKKYFKSENREFLFLIDEVKTLFSDLSGYQDMQTRVMDEAYKLIAHIYLKHLIGIRANKLRKRWHPEVGPTVTRDVRSLHDIVSAMAPGVAQRNLLLLEVQELLEYQDLEATKLTVGRMQEECDATSEDLELLPALLQWKGLSGRKIRKVLYGLENLPGFKHRPASWYSCCIGC